MARKLDLYWSASGLLDEARHWLRLALASGAGTRQERVLALAVAARFAVLQNNRLRARELIEEGTDLADPHGDPLTRGLLLVPAAMLAALDGTPALAAEQADQAVTLLRDASNRPGELLALFVAGVCHGFAGNSVQSTARHRQCVARADEHGERHMKALAVAGLGEQELAAGHLDEAAALFGEAIVLTRELGDRMGIAVGLDSLGRVATAQGRGSGQRCCWGPPRASGTSSACRRPATPSRSRRPAPTACGGPASFWARNGSVTCSDAAPCSPSTRSCPSPSRPTPMRIRPQRPSRRLR